MRTIFIVGLLAVMVAGCGTSSPPARPAGPPKAAGGHDHHHHHGHGDHKHPETLAEAAGELESLLESVGEHLAAGTRDAADSAVHSVGHLLEDMEGLIQKSTLVDDAKTAARKAVEELYECFDTLDSALHAKEGEGDSPADVHASLGERVKAAIDTGAAAVADAGGEVISAHVIARPDGTVDGVLPTQPRAARGKGK